MKKKIKCISLVIILFLTGCGGGECIFSERCYADKEKERILNLTSEERNNEKEKCVETFQRRMANTPNEERQCNFWECTEGKETWRRILKSCLVTLNNANSNRKEKTMGEIAKLATEERKEYIKEFCIREFRSVKEFFPTEKEYCRYFICDGGKENIEYVLNPCIKRIEHFIKSYINNE